ncbi:DUF309 domain-containing protein [Devosia sp. RR2S18]|uniref:DUF309 domain-containing protein n=1 Tax=Devosia rhizosphaerae TaxID=3049774 RepID=UPI002540C6AE|nr:DUF309 domain-containing protein [Devosia sp. RR2S18]WIJ26896.1 DUF309 domain-containing protein [Devosia sp. RR2S18]
MDLFNHGYYWEAHEAWEDVWQLSEGQQRLYLKALILLCAAGVKVREQKTSAAMRHGSRAAATMSRAIEDATLLPLHCMEFSPQHIIKGLAAAIDQILDNAGVNAAPYRVFPFELHPAHCSPS